jgi:hypothetical protein
LQEANPFDNPYLEYYGCEELLTQAVPDLLSQQAEDIFPTDVTQPPNYSVLPQEVTQETDHLALDMGVAAAIAYPFLAFHQGIREGRSQAEEHMTSLLMYHARPGYTYEVYQQAYQGAKGNYDDAIASLPNPDSDNSSDSSSDDEDDNEGRY